MISEVTLRPFEKEDLPFIFNSWLKSFKTSLLNRYIDDSRYFKYHHDVFESILNRPTCVCLVAVSVKDPKQIFGYIVTESRPSVVLLHWVYVKDAKRNQGIAKLLEAGVTVAGVPSAYTMFNKYNDKLNRERKYHYFPYYIAISEL